MIDKENFISDPREMKIGQFYISSGTGMIFEYTGRGRTKKGVCIFNLKMQGEQVSFPFTNEGVLNLRLNPLNTVKGR